MDDSPSYYYLIITIIVYIIIFMSLIGIFWAFILASTRTRNNALKLKYNSPAAYWILNIFFWSIILSLILFSYFFSVWYVMNDQVKNYWFPPNTPNL